LPPKNPKNSLFFYAVIKNLIKNIIKLIIKSIYQGSSAAQKNSKQEKNLEQKELIDYQREKLFLRNQIRHKNIFFKEKGFYCKKND